MTFISRYPQPFSLNHGYLCDQSSYPPPPADLVHSVVTLAHYFPTLTFTARQVVDRLLEVLNELPTEEVSREAVKGEG